MRIATWNINGMRARLDFVLHWLDARKPDLVGLQEIKTDDGQFPRLEIEAAGYQVETHGQKAWNGVAVLARNGIEVEQRGLPGQDEFGARLITARVNDIRFTTVYVPNGKRVEHEDFPKKLAWLDDLVKHLGATHPAGDQNVVCGDFNLCPEAIDTFDEARMKGKIFHTDEERARWRALLDLGFTDLFRWKHPDAGDFSWWDYRGGGFHRNLGLRIDFILSSEALKKRVTNVEIDREYRKKKEGMVASDHAPVLIDIE